MEIRSTGLVSLSDPTSGKNARVEKVGDRQSTDNGKPSKVGVVISPDEQSTDNAKAYQRFIKEEHSSFSQHAIASYQQFEKQSERENLQAMFGVDIYA